MDSLETLHQLIEQEIKESQIPGANYALVFADKVLLGSAGERAILPEVEENTIDTIYDMASLSKVVATTTAILQLLEQGRLRLQTKVKTYLPHFQHDSITIWHLLTHTSGLPEGVKGLMSMQSADEVWQQIYETQLSYETGMRIHYSDIGFILLGKIVEVITGMPLEVYTKQFIFAPLDMKDTGYNPKLKERCAPTEYRNNALYQGVQRGVVHDETAYLLGGVAGHAGLFSTIEDCAHFIQMILNQGIYQGKTILHPQTIDRLFQPEVEMHQGVVLHEVMRSLGWMVGGLGGPNGDLTSLETIHHTGFTGTSIFIDRAHGVGFCLLTNRVHPTRENTHHIDMRGRIANYVMTHYQKLS